MKYNINNVFIQCIITWNYDLPCIRQREQNRQTRKRSFQVNLPEGHHRFSYTLGKGGVFSRSPSPTPPLDHQFHFSITSASLALLSFTNSSRELPPLLGHLLKGVSQTNGSLVPMPTVLPKNHRQQSGSATSQEKDLLGGVVGAAWAYSWAGPLQMQEEW